MPTKMVGSSSMWTVEEERACSNFVMSDHRMAATKTVNSTRIEVPPTACPLRLIFFFACRSARQICPRRACGRTVSSPARLFFVQNGGAALRVRAWLPRVVRRGCAVRASRPRRSTKPLWSCSAKIRTRPRRRRRGTRSRGREAAARRHARVRLRVHLPLGGRYARRSYLRRLWARPLRLRVYSNCTVYNETKRRAGAPGAQAFVPYHTHGGPAEQDDEIRRRSSTGTRRRTAPYGHGRASRAKRWANAVTHASVTVKAVSALLFHKVNAAFDPKELESAMRQGRPMPTLVAETVRAYACPRCGAEVDTPYAVGTRAGWGVKRRRRL